MSIIHERPHRKAVPRRAMEHLKNTEKVSFSLLVRTINGITASLRQALF